MCVPAVQEAWHDSRNAPTQVAVKLAERGWLPDVIVSSDSTRTKQTLATMAEAHPAFREAATLFRGSLYTVAALDGQTRKHLQVCGHHCMPARLSVTVPGSGASIGLQTVRWLSSLCLGACGVPG